MHSTKLKFLESISNLGILPGGIREAARTRSFFVDATKFAKELYDTEPDTSWKDPVNSMHMRRESDIVIFIPGDLLARCMRIGLYRAEGTGDDLVHQEIPSALSSIRARSTDGKSLCIQSRSIR